MPPDPAALRDTKFANGLGIVLDGLALRLTGPAPDWALRLTGPAPDWLSEAS